MFELTKNIQKAVHKGNRKVILELYNTTFQVLMGNAVRYSNDKEKQMQIVNNAFMKIVSNINQYKIGTTYFSWAKQIVNREIIDDFRKSKKYNQVFKLQGDYQENQLEVDSYSVTNHGFQPEHLQKMLNQLPPATKLVFNLFAIDEYSYKDIAEELDISYETVKWHMKEARKQLRQEIKEVKHLKII